MSFDSSDKLEEKLTEYVPVALNSVGGQEEGLSSGIGIHACTHITQNSICIYNYTVNS